jgi:hypothetical protein
MVTARLPDMRRSFLAQFGAPRPEAHRHGRKVRSQHGALADRAGCALCQ